MDEFQERYLDHQERKKESLESFTGDNKITYSLRDLTALKEILMNRRSQRIFNSTPITEEELKEIILSVIYAPSSCNRQAIYLIDANPKVVEQYLVGGKNWINKANKVLLVFADQNAYKSPNERGFMAYLDAGFVCQNIYLMCEALGLGCCFVNPNIREENKISFEDTFGMDFFCGAIALGNYEKKSKEPPHRGFDKVIK